MKRHALWVEFEIRPGLMAAFLEEARKDAQGLLENEAGCLRFDVLEDPLQPNRAWFYEVYDNETSHQAHRETPHFKAFSNGSEPLIESKRILRLQCEEASRPGTDR